MDTFSAEDGWMSDPNPAGDAQHTGGWWWTSSRYSSEVHLTGMHNKKRNCESFTLPPNSNGWEKNIWYADFSDYSNNTGHARNVKNSKICRICNYENCSLYGSWMEATMELINKSR